MATKVLRRKRVWTYNELLAEKTETNQPTELWEGDLVKTPSPVAQHQRISFRVARLLAQFVSMHQLDEILLAPLDVVLTPRRVVQPDIVYISHARQAIIRDQIHEAPDLIVEVVSPGT
ncbi:MAG: Uma2 family endonuclease [Candidatus Methylomirabilis oxygeniifera]|nr:MAG: Uma2 family endonuclease [Candidatus Methylomirabilis oxyfera]